jgi:hypothetical protein
VGTFGDRRAGSSGRGAERMRWGGAGPIHASWGKAGFSDHPGPYTEICSFTQARCCALLRRAGAILAGWTTTLPARGTDFSSYERGIVC